MGTGDQAPNSPVGGNDPTRGVPSPGYGTPPGVPGSAPGGGHNTIIAGTPQPGQPAVPGGQPGVPPPHPASGVQEPVNFMQDPVVGWLVITSGPGKGLGLKLGIGMNAIGRDPTNRIALDYGDQKISREKHCVVTFEPKRRVFYIQHEGGTNLTYVGDAVVLQTQQLHNGEIVQIGDTEMRFIAFCGEDFSWDDTDE